MSNSNQLFRKTPPPEVCLKILNAFGLKILPIPEIF